MIEILLNHIVLAVKDVPPRLCPKEDSCVEICQHLSLSGCQTVKDWIGLHTTEIEAIDGKLLGFCVDGIHLELDTLKEPLNIYFLT